MVRRAVINLVVLHIGKRIWLLTFSRVRPEVTSSSEADRPLTRGMGVGDGVGVGVVGIGVGVGVGARVGIGVSVGMMIEVFGLADKADEKKATVTRTKTIMRTNALTRTARCFMLYLHFYAVIKKGPISIIPIGFKIVDNRLEDISQKMDA
jgi:hypothetical protein